MKTYIRATLTDQYLDLNSSQPTDHTLGVAIIVQQRADVMTTEHINCVSKKCKYPIKNVAKKAQYFRQLMREKTEVLTEQ